MTYKQIQEYLRNRYGQTVKTCWIAHAKELYGLKVRKAPNRIGSKRKYPCPPYLLPKIKEAFEVSGFLIAS